MGLKSTKIPQLPKVPDGLDPAVAKFLQDLKEIIEIAFGQNRGNVLDRFVTVRELQNAGLDEMALESGDDLVYRFDDLQAVGRDTKHIALIWPNEK